MQDAQETLITLHGCSRNRACDVRSIVSRPIAISLDQLTWSLPAFKQTHVQLLQEDSFSTLHRFELHLHQFASDSTRLRVLNARHGNTLNELSSDSKNYVAIARL